MQFRTHYLCLVIIAVLTRWNTLDADGEILRTTEKIIASNTSNYQLKQDNLTKQLDLNISSTFKCQPRIDEELNSKVSTSENFNLKPDKNVALTLKNGKVDNSPNSRAIIEYDQRARSRAFKEVKVPVPLNNTQQLGSNLNIGLNLDLPTE